LQFFFAEPDEFAIVGNTNFVKGPLGVLDEGRDCARRFRGGGIGMETKGKTRLAGRKVREQPGDGGY
jgi:hypothetical protein